MKRIFLPTLAAALFTALPALAGPQTLRVAVSDMTCPSCSYTVATAMSWVDSVKIVDFAETETFGEGIFTVSYDDTAATPEDILFAVTSNGYPAHLLQDGNS